MYLLPPNIFPGLQNMCLKAVEYSLLDIPSIKYISWLETIHVSLTFNSKLYDKVEKLTFIYILEISNGQL